MTERNERGKLLTPTEMPPPKQMADAADIAAGSPASFAYVTGMGRWLPFEHLLTMDDYLMRIASRDIDRLIVEAPVRHGKLCAHETLVMTPDGFVEHGNLKVGDEVFAPDGRPIKVQALGKEEEASWRIRFSDGQDIVTHGAHEWRVFDRLPQKRCWRIMETQEIAKRKLRTKAEPERSVIQVDNIRPLKPPIKSLPMDPYSLGAWLGDGSTSRGDINHHPDHPLDLPYEISSQYVHPNTGVVRTKYKGMWTDLKAAGVASSRGRGNKHIPNQYLNADEQSRWALLSGLIDTDGCVGKDGRVRFVNTNKILIEDIVHLVRTFGWHASLYKADPVTSTSGIEGRKPVWTVGFTPTLDNAQTMPARLSHKAGPVLCKKRWKRSVIAVERVDPRLGRCIQVEGGEYLVGETLIPTHNSELISKYTPAWWLGTHPDDQLILASYEAKFASSWGRKARDLLSEFGTQVFGVQVSETPSAADWWTIKGRQGVMISAGMRGGITGKGADLLIIDDPIKDAEQANSAVYRQKVWDWWLATAGSRLQPGGRVVLVMARWHEDDLAGRLQSEQGDRWTVLRIPALAEADDPLGRAEGDALCPEMYDQKDLLRFKQERGSYWFSALYQQRPSPSEGMLFKRKDFRYWNTIESHGIKYYVLRDGDKTRRYDAGYLTYIQTVDVAGSDKRRSDYTCVATWAVTPKKELLLIDINRQKFQTLHVAQFIENENDKHGRPPVWIETFGAGAVPYKQMQEDGYPVRTLKKEQGTQKQKWERALAAVAAYERGAIFHPLDAPFLGDYEEELVGFDTWPNDDQVDVTSYAARLLPMIGTLEEERPKRDIAHKPLTAGVRDMVW